MASEIHILTTVMVIKVSVINKKVNFKRITQTWQHGTQL